MSGCDNLSEKLEAHALEFLTGPDREAVDAHLRTCASCRKEFDDIRATLGLLENLPGRLALGGTARKDVATISTVTKTRPSGVRWGILAQAAAWLIAVGVCSEALWMGMRQGPPPDPRLEALTKRVESQTAQIDQLQKELIEDRARQSRERESLLAPLQARVDRQEELLRSSEEQGRRWTETPARVAELGRLMKDQERQIQDISERCAVLVRRSAEDSERLTQVLRQIDGLRPPKEEKPKPEVATAPVPAPPPVPAAVAVSPESPRAKNPVEAAEGFLWSVFRDRGGALNQKIRDYKDDLNRSYDNR